MTPEDLLIGAAIGLVSVVVVVLIELALAGLPRREAPKPAPRHVSGRRLGQAEKRK